NESTSTPNRSSWRRTPTAAPLSANTKVPTRSSIRSKVATPLQYLSAKPCVDETRLKKRNRIFKAAIDDDAGNAGGRQHGNIPAVGFAQALDALGRHIRAF